MIPRQTPVRDNHAPLWNLINDNHALTEESVCVLRPFLLLYSRTTTWLQKIKEHGSNPSKRRSVIGQALSNHTGMAFFTFTASDEGKTTRELMPTKDSHWTWERWQINVKRRLDNWRIYLFYYVHKNTIFSAIRAGISGVNYEQDLPEEVFSFGLSLALWMDLGHDFSPHTAHHAACRRHKMAQPILGKLPWPLGRLRCFQDMSPCFCCWTAEALIIYAILHVSLISALQVSWMVREQIPVISAETAGWPIQAIWAIQWGILLPQPLRRTWSTWFDDGLCWMLQTGLMTLCSLPASSIYLFVLCFVCYRLNKLTHSSHEYSYHRSLFKTIETRGAKAAFLCLLPCWENMTIFFLPVGYVGGGSRGGTVSISP